MKKVLFYFPQKPFPPQTGAHKRCLQLLHGLKKLGCEVMFASSGYRNPVWRDYGKENVSASLGCNIEIFNPSLVDKGISAGLDYFNKIFSSNEAQVQRLFTNHARAWFLNIASEFKPDTIFINYADSDVLVSGDMFQTKNCIIEMHDLVTVNKKMQLAIKNDVGEDSIVTGDLIDKLLDLEYYNKLALEVNPSEFKIYDKYRYTTCISKDEMDIVLNNTNKTIPVYIPMTYDVPSIINTYEQAPIFSGGPNPFNSQGYYLFLRKVLPLIKNRCSQFNMRVTGNFYSGKINSYASPKVSEGIEYLGFLTDLTFLYETARFFICPVFGGTGQQVKIIEAMAHGLPVVAFSSAATRSPICHGVNGLVAGSEREFAEHVLTLWHDKTFCKKLGDAARVTILEQYCSNRLVDTLGGII